MDAFLGCSGDPRKSSPQPESGPGPNLKKIKAEARAEMLFPDAADAAEMLFPDAADAAAPTARAPLFRPCDRLHAAF